jgi:hypothetical protein
MKTSIAAFLLLLTTSPAWAQITLTEQDFITGLNNTNNTTSYLATYTTYPSLAGLAGISGANQTWDFTGATYTQAVSLGTSTVLPYSDTFPLASDIDFNGATNVIKTVPANPKSPTTYGYIIIRTDGYFILGASQVDSTGVISKEDGIYYGEQFAAFPMAYQTTWSSISTIDAPGATSSATAVITGIVDGWGTLKIPPSPSTPALRSKMQLIYTDTNKTTRKITTDTQYIYKWYTKGAYTASMTTNGSAQTVLNASYAVTAVNSVNESQQPSNDELSLYLSQNPASNAVTNIIYTLKTDGPAKVELMDLLGRSVRMLNDGRAAAGQNVIAIDPKSLLPGSYFVRVEANGMSAMQKLVIQ